MMVCFGDKASGADDEAAAILAWVKNYGAIPIKVRSPIVQLWITALWPARHYFQCAIGQVVQYRIVQFSGCWLRQLQLMRQLFRGLRCIVSYSCHG